MVDFQEKISDVDYLFSLGLKQQEAGKFEEAVLCYCSVLVVRPDFIGCLNNLGNSLIALKRGREAEFVLRRVVWLQPNSKVAYYNLGIVLYRSWKLTEAIDAYDAAINCDPAFPEALTNRGSAKLEMNDWSGALNDQRQAIIFRPNFAKALCNLGSALELAGEDEHADLAWQRTLVVDRSYIVAGYNRSRIQLLHGNFSGGWNNYRLRLQIPEFKKDERQFPMPQWDGSDLAGRTILLHAEQGFGDVLQFCRYVSLFVARGAWVVMEVYPSLQPLIASMANGHQILVLSVGDPLPPADYHLSLMDAPGLIGTELSTIPASIPYLFVDEQLVSHWEKRFSEYRGLKVGFVWAGDSPKQERRAYATEQRRNMSLELFAPLLNLPGINFVSLQHGPARGELKKQRNNIFDPMNLVHDFADTAAIIANLDMVITVDTAVAHLAGAIGKSVWILSRYDGCWRWLKGRDDTPWYPTARIFRQKKHGDWSDVIARVVASMTKLLVIYRPDMNEIQHAFGCCQRQQGKSMSAILSLERALLLDEKNGDCWNDLGVSQQNSGFSTDASHHFNKAVAYAPDHAHAHNNLGNCLIQQGRKDEAFSQYLLAIVLQPNLAVAWQGFGRLCEKAGVSLNKMRACFDHARRSDPDFYIAHNSFASVCNESGLSDEAEEAARKAIELKHDYPDGLNNLSVALVRMGRPTEASVVAQQAIFLDANSASAYINLGNALERLGLPEEALTNYHQAIILEPDNVKSWNNIGILDQKSRRLTKAMLAYRRAILIQEKYFEAHVNLATALLARGDFSDGWNEFEWRLNLEDKNSGLISAPRWNGEKLDGKSILVTGGQRAEDDLLFVRYVPMLIAKGARVLLVVDSSLCKIFSRIPKVTIFSGEMPIPVSNYHISLLSLPFMLKSEGNLQPVSIPYLHPENSRTRKWLERLSRYPGLKVGLVWAGNGIDHKRNLPLFYLNPLLKVANVHFVSLQMGDAAVQLQEVEEYCRPYDFHDEISDFDDSAALMMSLDLVITVDAAVAHLAGALGKAVWVLSSFDCGWCWGEHGEESAWYPSTRIFRQEKAGDWSGVIADVCKRLAEYAEKMAAPEENNLIPETIRQLFNRGVLAHQSGQFKKALGDYMMILVSLPGHPVIFNHLGALAQQKGAYGQALRLLQRSILLQSHAPESLSNLAIVLYKMGHLNDAVKTLFKAIVISPHLHQPIANMARIVKEHGSLQEAINLYYRALIINSGQPEVHANLGAALLTAGNFQEGWREHEWRFFGATSAVRRRELSGPIWNGCDISGKTLFLYGEQGYGDVLQFCRYACQIAKAGAKVVLEVYPPLVRLLSWLPMVEKVIATGEPLPFFDFHLSLLSAPYVLQTRLDTIPAEVPYLKADKKDVSVWWERLPPGRKRVGIVWAGAARSDEPDSNYIDRQRSLALRDFMPLLAHRSVEFVSLQLGESGKQLSDVPEHLRPFDAAPFLGDFADTAALIETLDLVISVDTAVVHLAGALGKPVWVLSRHDGCWRWLQNRDDSPWYPGVKLFRQERGGEWEPVLERVAIALGDLFEPQWQRWRRQSYILTQSGMIAEAKRFLMAIMAHDPLDSKALEVAGLVQDNNGQISLERLLRLDAADHLAWNNLGYLHKENGDIGTASQCFHRAVILRPSRPKALLNLSTIWASVDQGKQAIAICRHILLLEPDFSLARNNLAALLLENGMSFEGREEARKAVILQPDIAISYNNQAIGELAFGYWMKAEEIAIRAIRLQSDYPETHVVRAMARLALGKYQSGWQDYEWRCRGGVKNWSCRSNGTPRWKGEALSGHSILLSAEQGLGDVIQFSRYAVWLAGQGAKVVLTCDHSLLRLLQTLHQQIEAVDNRAELPVTDFSCPLMSIPAMMGDNFLPVSSADGYLKPNAVDIERWRVRLQRVDGMRVGFAWAGASRSINNYRDIPLPDCVPLLTCTGVKIISLQYGARGEDIHLLPAEARPLHLMGDVSDFADCAALIANLDLVISVDTSIAHLTGALGKPLWLLSRKGGCWRWQQQDDFWYPSVRVFHQKQLGDWSGVLGQVRQELEMMSLSETS